MVLVFPLILGKNNKKQRKHDNLRQIDFRLNRSLFCIITQNGMIVKSRNFQQILKLKYK